MVRQSKDVREMQACYWRPMKPPPGTPTQKNRCKNLEEAAWVGCTSGAMRTAKYPPNCASHMDGTVINVCSDEWQAIRKHWKMESAEVD